jgi:hypothetical protein
MSLPPKPFLIGLITWSFFNPGACMAKVSARAEFNPASTQSLSSISELYYMSLFEF